MNADVYQPVIITCRSKEKPEKAAAHLGAAQLERHHILIDDFIANVRRWQKAGGTAIYYKNAEQAIAAFLKLVEEFDGLVEVFVDLDGVMADFDSYFHRHHGVMPRALQKQHGNDAEMWRLVGLIPGFWTQLPLMPGAMDLWRVVVPHRPTILTGCPRTDYDTAVAGKITWVQERLHVHVAEAISA